MSESHTWDLGWGNPYFLLKILDDIFPHKLQYQDIARMSYAPDEGFEKLIHLTKKIIKDTTGIEYRHVIITAGATQALNSILKYEKASGSSEVLMRDLGYPFYGSMLKHMGMERLDINDGCESGQFAILDSPSNPLGEQMNPHYKRLYWDAVYHNKIYNADESIVPNHRAMIGSYSKLLGLTGARIGWIATDDTSFYKNISRFCLYDTATISVPSQKLVIDILDTINVDKFLETGHNHLNDNRDELQKLSYLFNGQGVPSRGMFYCNEVDKAVFDLLDKSSVKYTILKNNIIRLSLGQTREKTREAVKAILKEDGK